MRKTILILALALLAWCNFASAQSTDKPYVLVGDGAFTKASYNTQLLRELNKKGLLGYKVFDRWQQEKEATTGSEIVFLMEMQSPFERFEYALFGDASFRKATYNTQLLNELNTRVKKGFKLIKRWQQEQEANSGQEIVYLMERRL
jgi:hypothetical protein